MARRLPSPARLSLAVGLSAWLATACIPGMIVGTAPTAPFHAPSSATASPAPGWLAAGARGITAASPFAGCPGIETVSGGSEVEPSLAADPEDPDHLLAAWQQDRNLRGGALGIATARSRDAGATWQISLPPRLTKCTGGEYELASDPVVSIGPDARSYLATLAVRSLSESWTGPRSEVVVSTSMGGGKWSDPTVVASRNDPRVFLDKETILADPRRPGIAFAAWQEYGPPRRGAAGGVNGAWFSRTTDGGRTWSRPSLVYSSSGETQFQQLLTLPDGTLLDVFVEARSLSFDSGPTPARIAVAISRDLGSTWSRPVTAARFLFTVAADPTGRGDVRITGLTIGAAVAPDGTIYVTWTEFHRDGPSVLAVARSDDGGSRWTPLGNVTTGASQAMLPALAVTADGAVGILWYDDRPSRSTGPFNVEVRLAASDDRGATWEEFRLAGPFDLHTATPSRDGVFVGDYVGLVGLSRGFAAVYPQARPASRSGATDLFFSLVVPDADPPD